MKTVEMTAEGLAEPTQATNGVLRSSHKVYSRLIGLLFLSAFVFYGVGNGLVTSVLGSVSTIPAQQTTFAVGTFLMLLNSVAVVGIGVLFFPILEDYGKKTALAYLASRIAEGMLLAIGVLFLLMIPSLAQRAVDAGEASAVWATTVGSVAIQSNTTAYQIGEMSLAIGSLFLCLLLFRTRLIPRFLAGWGVIGYILLLAGTIAEVFGMHIGLVLSIPGGLFEAVFAFWLLIKGL